MAATTTGLGPVLVLPSAPLVLPAASPAQSAEHRSTVVRVQEVVVEVRALLTPDAPCVVVAAAPAPGVHDHASGSLRPLGTPGVAIERKVDAGLAAALTERLGLPARAGSPLSVDATVLTALTPEASPVVVVEVAADAPAGDLLALGRALAEMAAHRDGGVQIVAAGDLSAGMHRGSPAYEVDGATGVQAGVFAALEADDLDALAAIGPDDARDAALRSWASVTVAASAATAAGLEAAAPWRLLSARGVGHAIGAWA